jgi:hypothetical protein
MATGAVIARIVSQYSDKGSKEAAKDIKRLGQNIDNFGRKATKSFGLATIAAGAFAGKLAVDAVQGAMADQKAQAGLALTLRNTAGATDEAIKANEAYLDSLELQVAIDNEQLIPALQTLVTGTGNLAKSQELLSLATNISAASGKDLGAVSMALSRAYNGNFTALTRLGIPLDKAALKSKNFNAITADLAETTKGQAAAAANTFAGRLEKLRLQLAQSADKVGYALLPALTRLADKISKDVVPALEKFIRLNGDDLARAFDGSIHAIERAANAMVEIAKFVDKFQIALQILGSAILSVIGYLKLLAATQAVRGFLQYMTAGLKVARAEMLLIGPASRGVGAEFAMAGLDLKAFAGNLRGISGAGNIFQKLAFGAKAFYGALLPSTILLGKILLVIGALYLAWKGIEWILNKAAQNDRKRAAVKQQQIAEEIAAAKRLAATYDTAEQKRQKEIARLKEQQNIILSGFKSIEKQVADANATNKKNAEDAARQLRDQQESAAAEAKKLRIQKMERAGAAKLALFNRKMLTDEKKMQVTLAAIKKNNAKLDKEGIKLTDPDEMTAIQMEAIYQNLLKGGKVLLAETTKQQKALDDLKLKAAEEYNKLLVRQQDILKALSGDNKVTIQEVGLLAKQWGMSAEAAQYYVNQVLAIADEKIDTTEIDNLAMSWFGNTGKSAREAAGKYLDFLNEINKGNGNISSEGIKKLAEKWFGGSGESATEAARKYEQAVVALKDNELGKKEVELLMNAWTASADEVAAYLLTTKIPFQVADDAKLMFSPTMINAIASAWNAAATALQNYLNKAGGLAGVTIPTVPTIPVVPTVPSGTSTTSSAAASAAKASESAASAIAYAVAKATGDTTKAALAAAGVRPSALAEGESGAIGAASIAAQLRAAEEAVRNASSLAAFKAKEAADLAASQAAAKAMDYDERFRFMASSGTASAGDSGFKGLQGSGTTNVTVNVAGSVTTEQDLVTTVRNGLLNAQYNGNQIILEAV